MMIDIPVALQLYTVRQECEKDFRKALEKVAQSGYEGVEFAGFWGLDAIELKKHLKNLGLKPAGCHAGLTELKERLEELIEYNNEIGSKHIACARSKWESRDEMLKIAAFLDEAGEKCKNNGLILSYHNHAHELEVLDGKYGLDLLYQNTKSDNVKAEIDTFWVKYAGLDPAGYVGRYPGRCPLVHIKDMDRNKGFTEVGTGIMDIEGIVSASANAGCEWLIVEQDKCSLPAMESVEISCRNLKNMLLSL